MIDVLRVHVNVRVWRHELDPASVLACAPCDVDGTWEAVLRARGWPMGRLQLWDEGHNLVVNSGLDMLMSRLQGAFVTPLSHMAVGTGVAAPGPADVALGGEVFRDVFTQVTTTPAMLVIRNYLGPNDANGFALSEAGLFNAAAGPMLYARRLFDTPLLKTPDSAATLEWTVSVSADTVAVL